MIAPFTSPIDTPVNAPAATAMATGIPESKQKKAIRPDRASTGPTDRSTPPVMITKVIPTAMMPTSTICRMIPTRFSGFRKAGSAVANVITIRTIASGRA